MTSPPWESPLSRRREPEERETISSSCTTDETVSPTEGSRHPSRTNRGGSVAVAGSANHVRNKSSLCSVCPCASVHSASDGESVRGQVKEGIPRRAVAIEFRGPVRVSKQLCKWSVQFSASHGISPRGARQWITQPPLTPHSAAAALLPG